MSSRAFSHGVEGAGALKEGLSYAVVADFHLRSASQGPSDSVWSIPGFLMGGEATPMGKGLNIGEGSLSTVYKLGDMFTTARLEQHGNARGVELSNLSLGYFLTDSLYFELGQLTSLAATYQRRSPFQDSHVSIPVVYDVFWGRHYTDRGLRFVWQGASASCGVELWTGDRFPAAQNDEGNGAGDIFCHMGLTHDSWEFLGEAFVFVGDSDRRQDERYEGGHSHGVQTEDIPQSFFTGTVEVFGVSAQPKYKLNQNYHFGVHAEIQQLQMEGDLLLDTRQTEIESKLQSLWVESFFQFDQTTFSLRYQHLRYKNDLFGNGAEPITEALGIGGVGDPIRRSIALRHSFDKNLQAKLEWQDNSAAFYREEVVLLGISWKYLGHIEAPL